MTRATKTKLRYAIIGAAVLIGLFVMFQMFGCAVGRSLDDDAPMVGVRLGDDAVIGAATSIGGAIGGIFGGPGGAALGASLAGAVATGIWGVRRGERKGWDEAVETVAGKPAVAPSVPAGGVPASHTQPA